MLNDFESNLGSILNDYHKNIIYNYRNKCMPNLIHNHVPVRFIVKGCPFCEKYGNYFSKNG